MKIVANSSILISLSSINRLSLLKEKFGTVYIPEAVWREVVDLGGGEVGSEEVKKAKWIKTAKVEDQNLVSALNESLDLGESEAIALSLQLRGDIILLDEKDARVIADKYHLKPMGSIGILIWAKRAKKIENLKSELDKLINEGGFRVAPEIYNRVLLEVGELESKK